MIVGDNIYHRESRNSSWIQEDSHHSNKDGSTNLSNLHRDTKSSKVLISSLFLYFGLKAPIVNLNSIGYSNHIGYSKKSLEDNKNSDFILRMVSKNKKNINIVIADPFNFNIASMRVDQKTGKIT